MGNKEKGKKRSDRREKQESPFIVSNQKLRVCDCNRTYLPFNFKDLN